ncbi:acetyl-CoA sensor PanZ family protein [Thorsellia kenyensis]|uniref:Acetyl-CoA sensor PanZ family protein n=1 Tax=Thorsellia kenyensis TaxID=1549888 RepID=A0ABV6C803_9GAMM
MSLVHIKTSYPEIAANSVFCADLLKISPSLVDELEFLHNKNDQFFIYTAHFNGHIIGLLSLTIDLNSNIKSIPHLIVRKSTQRRGVGLYLLHQSIISFDNEYSAFKPYSWEINISRSVIGELNKNNLSCEGLNAAYTYLVNALKNEFKSLDSLNITVISK